MPLAQSGVAIEGLDSAPDMLAILRKKAALLGLDDISLYEHYEFYKDSRLADCFMKDFWVRWYWKDEFVKLLNAAGFSIVQTITDSSLYQEGHVYVFRARK